METKAIKIPRVLTVRELAELLDVPVTDLMQHLIKNGILATINDSLDFDTAAIVAEDLGFQVEKLEEKANKAEAAAVEGKNVKPRPPVVVVMGHVDHGKTSLLDYIRQTQVAKKEEGGITQHIGAYQVEHKGKIITFLDTPGHEAFSAIRAQGAKVTDVAVLVVAADDGVKPQTVESIQLARAAEVPVVVALTKIDKPEANPEKVKAELAEQGFTPEEWGGKTTLVEVSSKTGEGVDELLDLIILSADLKGLKAPIDGDAVGVAIETRYDKRLGPVATMIVQKGSLKVGDNFVAGNTFGRVRFMENSRGERVKEALPGMPVLVAGFNGEPLVGDTLREVGDEKKARLLVRQRAKEKSVHKLLVARPDFSGLAEKIQKAGLQDLPVILKADVYGSLEAIKGQIDKIKTDKGGIKIVGEGLGDINESDVMMASSGNALVLGFKVGIIPYAKKAAEEEGVKLATYDVIYELTDDLKKLLIDSIEPERVELVMGKGKILKVFRSTAKQKIIGVDLTSGEVRKNFIARFSEGEKTIGEGKIVSIKHVAEELNSAEAPGQYGFLVEIREKLKEGDEVNFVKVEYRKPTL